MTPRLLQVLNRRLDFVFLEMECAWAVCKRERENPDAKKLYLVHLRRADRLWTILKPFSKL